MTYASATSMRNCSMKLSVVILMLLTIPNEVRVQGEKGRAPPRNLRKCGHQPYKTSCVLPSHEESGAAQNPEQQRWAFQRIRRRGTGLIERLRFLHATQIGLCVTCAFLWSLILYKEDLGVRLHIVELSDERELLHAIIFHAKEYTKNTHVVWSLDVRKYTCGSMLIVASSLAVKSKKDNKKRSPDRRTSRTTKSWPFCSQAWLELWQRLSHRSTQRLGSVICSFHDAQDRRDYVKRVFSTKLRN